LRKQGLAKTQRGKFNDNEGSVFRTPEEAQEYLTKLQFQKKKTPTSPSPPSHLTTSDLNDWFSQQRRKDLEERQKRIEAENLLRGYRATIDFETSGESTGKSDTNAIVEPIVEDTIVVSDEIDKHEQNLKEVDTKIENQGIDIESDGNTTKLEEKKEEEHDEIVEVAAELDSGESDGHTKGENTEENEEEELKTALGDNVFVNDEVEVVSVDTVEPILESNSSVEKMIDLTSEGTSDTSGKVLVEIDAKENSSVSDESVEEVTENIFQPQAFSIENDTKYDVESEKQVEASPEQISEERQHGHEEGKVPVSGEGWRNMISNESGVQFPSEAKRYHLYVAHACPWAHRTVLVRNLKGLQVCIGVTYVHPTWQFTKPGIDDHRGWVFGKKDGQPLKNTAGYGSFPSDWGEKEPHFNAKSIRDLYEKANDDKGKYILPVLWDTKMNTIVSNESSEIIRMLNSEFNEFAKNKDLDLYPEELSKEIDAVNAWVYPTFNNGVYRCGLASSQEAYNAAIEELTTSFDKIDTILQKQRYIVGDVMTEADIRLFVTLLRFDEVYDVYFKTNTRSVAATPSLLNYVREIYRMDGVTESCDMEMIKAHYYTSHVELNKYSIIPRGSNFMGLLDMKPESNE